MKQFVQKLRLIFIPFLLLSTATVAIYTFLHWLLFIDAKIYPLDEEVLNLWGPMIVPAIPVLIWLRPRLKLLELKSKGKDPLMGYIMFAWMAMIAPGVVAQEYLIKATGKLTKLDQISEIDRRPETKYYTVKHFFIDKKLVAAKTTFGVSGKYNADFDMTIYAPCPIFNYDHTPADTQPAIRPPVQPRTVKLPGNINKILILLNGRPITPKRLMALNHDSIRSIDAINAKAAVPIYGEAAKFGVLSVQTKQSPPPPPTILVIRDANADVTPIAWLALKYQKTISNKLSQEEKQARYKEFAQESQRDFNTKQLDKFVYLDRLSPSKDLKNYQAAVNSKNKSVSTHPIIVLSPVNEPFEERSGHTFAWIFGAFGIGALIFMITLLAKPLKTDTVSYEAVLEPEEKSSGLEEFKALFFPREGYYVTPIIVDINVAIFLMMAFAGLGFLSFQTADLLKYGANYRPYILNGEYWRLFTAMFLHGGLMHVLLNMYGLVFVGLFLEPVLGRTTFAIGYLITGIAASIASIWWHPATPGVGASGAIFGMYGIFLALLTTNIFPKDFKKSFLISTSIFVGYNLLFGLTPGIDNAAHIGGLLSGLILGYTLYPSIKNRKERYEATENEVMAAENENKELAE